MAAHVDHCDTPTPSVVDVDIRAGMVGHCRQSVAGADGQIRDRSGSGRRWSPAAIVAIGLLAAACSGGGGSGTDSADLRLARGETVPQFEGAAKVRMGGTLAVPGRPGGTSVGAALTVPSLGRDDRYGAIDVVPGDPLYQALSKAITGAGRLPLRPASTGTSRLDPGQQVTFDDMVTDAHQALLFLSQRRGIDPTNPAIVGHDIGGIVAMRLAATDDKVTSVVFLSTPGRPLVDIMAGDSAANASGESADAFRGVIGTLLSTGALPDRTSIRPEHHTALPVGQDALLRWCTGSTRWSRPPR